MTCQFQTPRNKVGFNCSLNLYGGRPHAIACKECIAKNNNNKEFADALFASVRLTHPQSIRRVSGCCDSALNPPGV